MSKKLKEILLEKYSNQTLAHFYLLAPSPIEELPEQSLKKWVLNFIKSIYKLKSIEFNLDKKNYADVLYLKREEATKDYSKKDDNLIEKINKFCQYTPLDLNKKIIILEDSQRLPENYGAKLLKTLEEPPPFVVFFFLCPQNNKLPQTIESRGIKLTVPVDHKKDYKVLTSLYETLAENFSELNPEALLYFKTGENISNFIDALKGKNQLMSKFINVSTHWASLNAKDYESVSEFIESLKWYKTSKIFNNSKTQRLVDLAYHLKKMDVDVLP